ncbi:hypothetical protein ABAC460_11740 [Asticcacaulis sp. AC460]|uniref:hypothetical protein n=1 Tax=Asticcacaulis sp. AC460 TaxID=1282360 RepID=UPI0003C3B17E|nr:hypothetical protein [Asticcacaulis sp. AC460]ESQ89541.1 hypothetical protein ABAC460_11740 [Asticcacaulis sp. AC460]
MTVYSEQELLAANVNPATGLATDYLNLFNEAIMLFEMGLDMPDMAEELADWHKRDYVHHFENSGFEMKDVVIWAYRHAPADIRCAFDECCEKALVSFDSSINILLSSNLDDEAARADLAERLRDMKGLVVEMDSHIHGRAERIETNLQNEVDALF